MIAKIYCGTTEENINTKQLHPVNEVIRAKKLVDSRKEINECSNSPDFIATIKYYGEKKGFKCEFFFKWC